MGYIFLVMIGLGIALKLFKRTEKGNFMFDQLLLKIPLIGVLLQKTAIARFSRTLSTMLQSGVPILQSLDIVAKTSGNKVIEKKLLEVKLEVSRGQSLAAPMAQAKIFPPLVVQMTAVGEETGELENMLSKIADFYEAEVDAAVEALTSMLEPMMIVFLGGLIGGLVVALYLPIFKLGAVVGG
ncbi:Type II secretion system protein F [Candidatus Methanoperedenaceae archaeon GB37]|nr:Type II secretion system protein F [Candidatus Methanoperedenaceae archaeon GB37]